MELERAAELPDKENRERRAAAFQHAAELLFPGSPLATGEKVMYDFPPPLPDGERTRLLKGILNYLDREQGSSVGEASSDV